MKKFMAIVIAAFIAAVPSLYGAFTATCGKYQVKFSALCTISEFFYDGTRMINNTSYNTTILILPSVPEYKGPRFIGAGNSRFGSEKRLGNTVICDGKTIAAPAGEITGKNIKVVRATQCQNIKITYTTDITEDGITVISQLEAVGDQELASAYIHQFTWDIGTSEWISRMHNNAMFSGKFESKGAFHLHRTALRTLWFSLYNSAAKKGVVVSLEDETAMAGGCRFWDRPASHALYYQPGVQKKWKAGDKSIAYTMTIKGYASDAAGWKDAAAKVAGE